ncbi:MAG TPA: hypothetical protein V6D17_03470 [Candidatus Obscuribacterales bacterium]
METLVLSAKLFVIACIAIGCLSLYMVLVRLLVRFIVAREFTESRLYLPACVLGIVLGVCLILAAQPVNDYITSSIGGVVTFTSFLFLIADRDTDGG